MLFWRAINTFFVHSPVVSDGCSTLEAIVEPLNDEDEVEVEVVSRVEVVVEVRDAEEMDCIFKSLACSPKLMPREGESILDD
jgi:hypothetical protein